MRIGKKGLFLFVVLVTVAAGVHSQGPGTTPYTSTNYNWNAAWVIDTRATASLDGQGRVMSILTEGTDDGGSSWSDEGLTEFVYSSTTFPDSQINYFWNTNFNTWDPINRLAFQYDGLGNVLLQTMQQHPATTWQNSQRTSYTRDGLGKPIEMILEIWSSGQWNNSQRTVYNFNGDQLADKEHYVWLGADWLLTSRSVYAYGADGEIEELQQSWNSMTWTDTHSYQTTYSGGNPSVYLHQVWNGTMWVDQDRRLYESYDAQGRLLAEDKQFYVGLWQNTYRSEYDYDTPTSIGDELPSTLPNGLSLHQNYPNPFNPSTVIAFTLPSKSAVAVTVYDLLGRTVANLYRGELPAGEHSLVWDGRGRGGERVASGVYFYRIATDDGSLSRKMLLVK